MSKHSICILGGTGFVGGHLVPALAAAGHDILLPTRNRERNRDLLVLPTVRVQTMDIHNEAELRRAFANADVVINLVGILNERGRDGSGFRHAHVDLTGKAVAAAKASGVRRFLQMSALKANASAGPSHYLKTKGEAEETLRREAGTDLDWTIFQPSVIFGPGDSFVNRFASLLRVSPLVLPLAKPNARLAPVYVGDVVAAFLRSLDDPACFGQTYQLCGPQVVSLRELVQIVAEATATRRRLIGLSDMLSKAQARIMDFVPGKPFSTDNYLSLTIHNICDENGFKKLGLRPRSLKTELPRTLGTVDARERYSVFRQRSSR